MLLKSIKIEQLLSFQEIDLELRPLNVLIGANASGKSNLIEIMALSQAVPRDLGGFVRRSGGMADWLWKGENIGRETGTTGTVEAIVAYDSGRMPLRYALSLSERGQQFDIAAERLENERPSGLQNSEPFQYFDVAAGYGRLAINWRDEDSAGEVDEPRRQTQQISRDDLTPGQSVLRERKDPTLYQEMNFVGRQFDAIRLYREWNLGRNSEIRRPQPTDSPNDFLEENFSNLALVLNRLESGPTMSLIEGHLRDFYEMYDRLGVNIDANTAQLWIREKGLTSAVPATRLSDGTLRFLALLSILCHPNPPPLVCIEEPELGLHPNIIPMVAKLLKSASERTQLIITTHSERLIDELHDDPESVVVCERYPSSGTELKRLDKKELKIWLENYELGELWAKGQIGGTRW
jgi:predicted ATPase